MLFTVPAFEKMVLELSSCFWTIFTNISPVILGGRPGLPWPGPRVILQLRRPDIYFSRYVLIGLHFPGVLIGRGAIWPSSSVAP